MKKQIFLILLSPILLSLGWPPIVSGFLLLIGFVPLLLLEKEVVKWYGLKIYISILLWNIGATWWVWNASAEGCIAMLLANSFLMSLTFLIYRKVNKYFGVQLALVCWIISWLSMEYLHLNWEAAFPWLNLGNGLAAMPSLIQWYEYTGTLGGTLWILTANCLIFKLFTKINFKVIGVTSAVIILPIIISLMILFYQKEENQSLGHNVVVIQPNIDPYTKFEVEDPKKETTYFQKMAESQIDSITEFLLFPETSLTENCEDRSINNTLTYNIMSHWLSKYPNATLISGCNTYHFFDSMHKTNTSRKHFSGQYFDIYNSSLVMDQFGVKDIYRKSKLVPGVEKMPYTHVFGFLEDYAINLGGISGSLGEDTVARVFYSKKKIGAAPLICYESIFGEYVSTFVKNGANVIFILTNDGWWGNTPGYQQHKLYGRLRAIETRRDVVRCTNTGTSCIIDKMGNISGETPWWESATRTYKIYPHNELTFYTRFGDYLGKMSAWLFSIVFILSIAGKTISKRIFS